MSIYYLLLCFITFSFGRMKNFQFSHTASVPEGESYREREGSIGCEINCRAFVRRTCRAVIKCILGIMAGNKL